MCFFSGLCARLFLGDFNQPIVAQNVLARTFELRSRNFPDFHLVVFSAHGSCTTT